ncbi:MAG: hypothetical protein WA056_08400 [Gallionella sp.]
MHAHYRPRIPKAYAFWAIIALAQIISFPDAKATPPAAPPASSAVMSPQGTGDLVLSADRIARALEAGVAQREADKSDDRPARDLNAQEEMARWAKVSFFVILASAIVSGLGLFALIYSLRLNQRATTAAQSAVAVARETNESQSRAWLSAVCMLERPSEGTTQGGIDGIYFNVACQAKNHGRSPATSISFHAEIALLRKDSLEPQEMMNKYCDSIRERADRDAEALFPDSTTSLGHMVFLPKKDIASDLATKDFKMISPVVYGCLNYKTLYTKGVRQTRFLYYLATVNDVGQVMVLRPDDPNWLKQPIGLTQPGTVTTD